MFIEMVFIEYHGSKDIHKGPGIMDKVTEKVLVILKNHYNIQNYIVHCMMRTRTFIWLNHWNKMIQEKLLIKDIKN